MGLFKGKRKRALFLSNRKKSTVIKEKYVFHRQNTDSPYPKQFKFSFSPIHRISPSPSNREKTLRKQNCVLGQKNDTYVKSAKRKLPFSPRTSHYRHDDTFVSNKINREDFDLSYELDKEADEEKMRNLLPYVLSELDSIGKHETLINFFQLVSENRFPLKNIAFTLWCDLVSWYTKADARTMRYSPETMQFFWVGRKLFGGRFIRFMSGMKLETSLLKGLTELDTKSSDINFPCPSENILRDFNPFTNLLPSSLKPGFLESVIELKATKDDGLTSYVIMFDGKKVKRGGDVDLLGHEPSNEETLETRKKNRDDSLEMLQKAIDLVDTVQKETNVIRKTSEENKKKVYASLTNSILLFSAILQSLRKLKVKKTMALEKLKEKAGINDWRKSPFAYSIDMCRTILYKIENTISKILKVQMSICKSGASLNNAQHLFADCNRVDLQYQENLRILKSPEMIETEDEALDTSVVKQRSDRWFSDRKTVKATGSSLYKAIGGESLKQQKEHFDNVVSNIEPPSPSEDQQKAMKHGTECEINEIATMCSVVMPFLFPEMTFCEEGYYLQDDVLVSPDGSLRSSESTDYAFEGKAPMKNPFTTPVHYTVPERYITQTLFEQRVLQASEGTIYMSWSEESCTVYKIIPDEDLCQSVLSEIRRVYYVEIPKRPNSLSFETKHLKKSIGNVAKKCIFLGEFPSVYGYLSQNVETRGKSPFIEPQRSTKINPDSTYDDLLQHLFLAKEVILDTYELQRPIASQVVVYLLSDLDRLWKAEEPHAIPITYFFRGYSLSMDVMRSITRECKKKCQAKGLDVVVCAADGEFCPLMVRGNNGNPLTLHQLSKDVWAKVCKLTKQEILLQFYLATKNVRKVRDEEVFENNDKTMSCNSVITLESVGAVLGKVKTPTKGWKRKERKVPTKKNGSIIENLEESSIVSREEDLSEISLNIDLNEPVSPSSVLTEEKFEKDKSPVDAKDTHTVRDQLKTTKIQDSIQLTQTITCNSTLNMTEVRHVLIFINAKKWNDLSEESIEQNFRSADTLKKFTVKELIEITKLANTRLSKQLKTSGINKAEIINQLSRKVCDGSQLEVIRKKRKVKNIPQLKILAAKVIKKKTYPKQVLNIAYANYRWDEEVRKWRASANVSDKVIIKGVKEVLEPYYVPDTDPTTGNFEIFVYDKTHLGSNLRKAICLDKVETISKSSWEKVSDRRPDVLNSMVIEVSEEGKIIDQMKEKLARTLFNEQVEDIMTMNGDTKEAEFCNIIRNALYEAVDTPGIAATERCLSRIKLIEWLKRDVDFGDFPPYGSRIKGMSHVLYEGLRSSNEAKLYLYALTKKKTYCVRAPNTLCSETFFGTMQEMDPWGQGVLSTKGVEKHMTDFVSVTAMRMQEDKSFSIRTKKDAAYPVQEIPTVQFNGYTEQNQEPMECLCRLNHFIKCIIPRDHFFDTSYRKRRSRKNLTYKFSDLNCPAKGDLPIRSQYGYTINEAKMLPSKRMGIMLDGE